MFLSLQGERGLMGNVVLICRNMSADNKLLFETTGPVRTDACFHMFCGGLWSMDPRLSGPETSSSCDHFWCHAGRRLSASPSHDITVAASTWVLQEHLHTSAGRSMIIWHVRQIYLVTFWVISGAAGCCSGSYSPSCSVLVTDGKWKISAFLIKSQRSLKERSQLRFPTCISLTNIQS